MASAILGTRSEAEAVGRTPGAVRRLATRARFELGLAEKSWDGDELRVIAVDGLTGTGHHRGDELAGSCR